MLEVLWGIKINQSSIQNAHMRCAVGKEGWLTFRNAVAVLAVCFCLHSHNSFAATDDNIPFNIPQQRADTALTLFAEQANLTLVFPFDQVKDITANRLVGQYPIDTAVNILLQDTGLTPMFSEQLVLNIAIESKGKRMNIHKTHRKTLLAGLVGLFAAGGSLTAVAQGDEAATGQSRIDEIIVTAQKREQKAHDIPMSISALSGEDLSSKGIADLQSLSLAVPGLSVVESGFLRRVTIRGIGNIAGNNGSALVGMYVDEASVSNAAISQLDLRMHDLERVEVLKGPQGTLYGEGSVGGAVRYITNDPQLDGFSGNISIDGSSTSSGDTSQELKGVVNIPLSDSLGLRVVGQYDNAGGWIDQPSLSKSNINNYELFNIRSKLLWQPTDSLTLKATAIVHRNNMGAQNTGEDENGNYRQSFDDPTTPSAEDNYDLYNFLLEYDMGGFDLISSTSYLDSDRRVNNFSNQCCAPTDIPGELWNQLTPITDTLVESWTQELRATSTDVGLWHWSAGLFYKDAKVNPFLIPEVALLGVPGGTQGVDLFPFTLWSEERSQSWAVFGETSYDMTDRLEVGVGLRYFEDDREFQGAIGAPVQQDDFQSVNPKFYISYDLTEDTHFYANASKGFRSGGFNGLDQPSYDPESVWSYELGSKMKLMDGSLRAEIALFYSEYDDYQVNGRVPDVILAVVSNSGRAEVQGVDLSLTYFATEHIELGFTGNYTDTEFVEINSTSSSHAVGDPLDIVPQYDYSLWGNYAFSWFDRSPGFLRFDYSRQGKANFTNRRLDVPAIDFVYRGKSDVIDMLNARVGWEGQAWSAQLYALNLLDEGGFIGPLTIERHAARPRPRTVGLNFDYRF